MVKSYRPKYVKPKTPKAPSTKITKPLRQVMNAKQIKALQSKPISMKRPTKSTTPVFLKANPPAEYVEESNSQKHKRFFRTVL